MERHPSDDKQRTSASDPECVQGGYVLDKSSGLYLPEAEKSRHECDAVAQQTARQSPLNVNVRTDWVLVIISILTLLGIGGTVYYTARQSHESQISATAATVAAWAARDAVMETRLGRQRASRQAQQDRELTEARNRAAMEFSQQQSRASLDTSIKTSRADQRAWVGVVSVRAEGGKDLPDGFSFDKIIVTIHNSGKTPALKLAGDCCIFTDRAWNAKIPDYDTATAETYAELHRHTEEQIREHPENAARIKEFEKSYIAGESVRTGGVIAPAVITHVTVAQGIKLSGPVSPNPTIQDFSTVHYMLGKFTYNDIFTGTPRHSTKFCLMQRRGESVTICPDGNWMD